MALTALSLSIVMWKPVPVSAAAKYPECANTYLEDWDWPGMLKAPTTQAPNSGAGLTSFNYDTDSYFIYKTTANQTGLRNVFTVVFAESSNNNKLTLDQTGGGSGDRIFYNGTIWVNQTLVSEPNTIKAPSQNWAGSPGGSWVGFNDGTFAIQGSTSSFGSITLNNTISCVVVAHNMSYSPGWTYDPFPGNLDYAQGVGTGTSQTCAALDIACSIKSVFRKVEDTFIAVGQAIVNGIAILFKPDTASIQADFNSLSTFLNNKLGFIAYPFTFLVDVFNAFSGTSNNWCTTSSCTKDFGTLFGHDFIVDLNAPQIAYPTLWAWFKNFIIGVTVLELLIAIYGKYKAIIRR